MSNIPRTWSGEGTYVSAKPFHLFHYIDEEEFRFNTRKGNNAEQSAKATKIITGKRLNYKELTGNEDATEFDQAGVKKLCFRNVYPAASERRCPFSL